MHDDVRIQAIKADFKYPKKSMFNRVHTIQESIDKFEKENVGKATSRKAEYQLTHSMGYNKVSTGSIR